MIDEGLQDNIEKYLTGELASEEIALIESEMKTNRELFEEVEIQRLSLMALQKIAAADLKEKFTNWGLEESTPDSLSHSKPLFRDKPYPWIWGIGILFFLLLSMAFWHFQQIKKNRIKEREERLQIIQRDSTILALKILIQQKQEEATELQPASDANRDSLLRVEILNLQEELKRIRRTQSGGNNYQDSINQQIALAATPSHEYAMRGASSDDNLDPIIKSVYNALGAGNYAEAVYLLKNIKPDDIDGQRVVTYELPYALFYAGKFGEAGLAFQELKKTEKAEAEKVDFYILLCYVGDGRKAFARKMIADILKNPQHKFYKNAKKLQSDLEKK
jgi:hypothetical protein